jgi:F-type H+-transporting ATPase subunit delta
MADYKVSLRYANSLFGIAQKKKLVDVISKDAELIHSAFEDSRELSVFMGNPVIKTQMKISAINEIFKDKINAETFNFLLFVVNKGRESLLSSIFEKYLGLRDVYMGIINVDVSSASDFTDAQKEHLKKIMEESLDKKIRFRYSIDDGMIGGFVAKVGDTVYDASLKHQLEILKKQFLQGGFKLN